MSGREKLMKISPDPAGGVNAWAGVLFVIKIVFINFLDLIIIKF